MIETGTEDILSGFSLTMRESLETSALLTEHRPPFLSLSLIKLCPLVSYKSCVLSRIRVLVILIVLNFLKDAYKVFQGVPPTYFYFKDFDLLGKNRSHSSLLA